MKLAIAMKFSQQTIYVVRCMAPTHIVHTHCFEQHDVCLQITKVGFVHRVCIVRDGLRPQQRQQAQQHNPVLYHNIFYYKTRFLQREFDSDVCTTRDYTVST